MGAAETGRLGRVEFSKCPRRARLTALNDRTPSNSLKWKGSLGVRNGMSGLKAGDELGPARRHPSHKLGWGGSKRKGKRRREIRGGKGDTLRDGGLVGILSEENRNGERKPWEAASPQGGGAGG